MRNRPSWENSLKSVELAAVGSLRWDVADFKVFIVSRNTCRWYGVVDEGDPHRFAAPKRISTRRDVQLVRVGMMSGVDMRFAVVIVINNGCALVVEVDTAAPLAGVMLVMAVAIAVAVAFGTGSDTHSIEHDVCNGAYHCACQP